MRRMPVTIVALAISACEHGQQPPPGCGNRVIDFGEQCDDGNDVAGDGCDQCVADGCGNGVTEGSEQCDDGNNFGGDGCTADCFFEESFPTFLTSFWTFQDLDGTTTSCPTGFPRIDISASGEFSGSFIDQFDCSSGAGSGQALTPDLYTVVAQAVSQDGLQVFATSLPQQIDLRMGNGTFATTFFNDAGFFGVTWVLQGAVTNNVLDCAQANVGEIEIATTPNGSIDLLECTAGSGFTAPLAAGSYTVSITAKTGASQTVGTATPLTGRTIDVPNVVTDLGTITIPIAGM